MPAPRDCPCHSGERYNACCGPYHRGAAKPETPEALMRSRYAAFALGLGDYLTETLASDHPDRAMSAAELSKGLFASWRRQRFLGLTIASAKTDGDQGQVLFLARVFEKGQDRSFAELSQFRKEAGGWRYASGVLVRKEDLPSDVASLTPEALLALAR